MNPQSLVFHPMTPPRMPTDLEDLDRATMLLGHMAKGPMKQKFLRELERLLGELPHRDVVMEWKTALKQHRKNMACELQVQDVTAAQI